MNNYAIARVFRSIGDLMEILGENPYKIKAYRTAAETMEGLTESLATIAERGELQTVSGIGEAIAAKTQEILGTGTCKLYEDLKARVPESLTELLGIPRFGTKKIQTVWKELGITTLEELETAARDGRLRDVKGLGEKTETDLLAAIEGHRRRLHRTPIHAALPYAEGLARLFRETGTFDRLEVAGSVRRMRDTVSNLDLAGAAADPAAALEAVATHPEVHEVCRRGEDWIEVCTEKAKLVTVRVSPPERFGNLLQRSTGSEGHNARLEALAREAGVDLEEPTADEEVLYSRLGLPYIAPELREDRGEIEAAREDRLPKLIEKAHIRGILHAHSLWSDGSASIAGMAEAARALGYSYHGNTDHSKALGIARGLDERRLREQMTEIDALNAAFEDGFRILKGIECDILIDGSLDLPDELLAELDWVVGSVHSHQRLDEEAMTRRIARALDSGRIDMLAHPTGRILGMRDSYAVDMERVFDAAAANGVALEINAAERLDLNDVLARQAADRGIPICINSDAHSARWLDAIDYGIAQARRAWLEPENVVNTWPLERVQEWVRSRRR